MAATPFLEKLLAAARAHHSLVCVGLDPDPALAPPDLLRRDPDDWVASFNRGIVEATSDLVCCYKPNLAFYEALGDAGMRALRATMRAIPEHVPVLLDAKRADIGNTSRGYARAVFDDLGADAVTVNPYLGGDSLAPFFAYADKGVFVLCKTSNPGSGEIQDLPVRQADGTEEALYRVVARRALEWGKVGTVGYVVGATYPQQVADIRRIGPRVPILLPGVGAQAGDLVAAVRAGVDEQGERAIVNASRSILYASSGSDWRDAARRQTEALRDAINAARAPEVHAR